MGRGKNKEKKNPHFKRGRPQKRCRDYLKTIQRNKKLCIVKGIQEEKREHSTGEKVLYQHGLVTVTWHLEFITLIEYTFFNYKQFKAIVGITKWDTKFKEISKS